MPGQLSVWPICLFTISKPEIGRIKNSFSSSKRCNEGRRMSEGALVMPSCTAASFNNNNNGGDRPANPLPRRKFSFPAVLQSQSLCAELGGGGGGGAGFGNGGGGGGGPSLAVATARRRFSNVSDVVSRKLSHTIGWRTAVPTEQIARQGKALCAQYIRWKLKRAGVYTKKCAGALRSARTSVPAYASAADVGGGGGGGGYFISASQTGDGNGRGDDEVRREVFPAVLRIGLQLERLNPKLYATGVTAACPTAASAAATAAASAAANTAANNPAAAATAGAAATVVTTAGGGGGVGSRGRPSSQLLLLHRRSAYARRNSTTAAVVLVSVSRELFRAGAQVTWAKVVSLVCVAAGLAVDCARRGRGEQLADLVETVGEVIEDDLAAWIHYNGGWMGLQSYCKPVVVNVENPVSTHIKYLVSLLIIVILFLLLLRWMNFISVFR